MGIRTRLAQSEDAAAIARIYNEGITDRVATFETDLRTTADIEAWFTPDRVLVVAEDAQGVVAFASTSPYRSRPCYAGVAEFSVYVAREARGLGAGTLVMRALLEHAEASGSWKLVSRVFPENTASRVLLKKLGFREVGVYEKHARLDGGLAGRGDRRTPAAGESDLVRRGPIRAASAGTRSTAATAKLIVHDAATGIDLDPAAVMQQLLERLPASLHPGFHAREGEPRPDRRLFLRHAMQIDQRHGIAIVRRQPHHHRSEAMRKFTFGPSGCVIAFLNQSPGKLRPTLQVEGSTREQLSPPHGCPVEIRNSVAGHLKKPGDEALAVLK